LLYFYGYGRLIAKKAIRKNRERMDNMSFDVTYEGSKMIIPELSCDCGYTHAIPDIDVYIGRGILPESARHIRERNLGDNLVLVADNITYEVAGKDVEKVLKGDGFQVTLCILERDDELKPDETAIGEVLLSVDSDTNFLVAVGSGSVTDVTRYVAFRTGKPFVSIGTAASMDGYTSVVAPLLFNGQKVNKPSGCPLIIICDIDVMMTAPEPMFVSGVGDVLGKYIAKADWLLGNIINDEVYCPLCADIITKAVDNCMANIDIIRNRTPEGTRILIEALILAGITILIVGNTRPVASIEHNMGHYWEMKKLERKEETPSHGTAVGVGTIYSLKFFDYFLNIDLSKIDKDQIRKNRLTREGRIERMTAGYGEKIAQSIMHENPEDFLSWDEQERRIDRVSSHMEQIREVLSFLPSAEEMTIAMNRLGAPTTAAEISIDQKLLRDTFEHAKDYRSRYTVFKTLDELGLLNEAIEKILGEVE
jgi:glycerol-1-phosphate dehydrogenase [NAD(P)+]